MSFSGGSGPAVPRIGLEGSRQFFPCHMSPTPTLDVGDPGPKSNILLVVQEWAVVEDEDARWRYRQFGFAGGFLCWNQAIAIHVVGVDKIISHFARTFFDQRESEHFQVLPLNKA
jgi:hypothetical protein